MVDVLLENAATSSLVPPSARPIPPAFLGALAVAGGFMAFTAWDQSYWWRTKQDYGFGWLVPVFAAYVVYARWPRIVGRLAQAEAPASHSRWFLHLVALLAPAALAGGIALFLLGAFERAAAGTTHLSSLFITLGMASAALATVYYTAPAQAEGRLDRANERWALTALFLFPALVWLVSAPLLSVVDDNLALYLMHQVTSIVFFVFDRLGLTLEQHGNVLMLPSGSVGVEEACSGVRSLTGCLFAGAFLGAMFVRSFWRKWALIVSSLLFAFLANLARSLFLTSWAYHFGAPSIEGTIHDASGYAVLGLAVVALLCLLPLLDPPPSAKQDQS